MELAPVINGVLAILEDPLWQLSIAAAFVMFVGYAVYIYLDIKYELIDPNPLTWLMFAYGTVLLTFLEYMLESNWRVLLVPIVCSMGGVLVMIRCTRKHPITLTRFKELYRNRWDRFSFLSDVFITIGYTLVWLLVYIDALPREASFWGTVVFLWLSNLSTVPQFMPMYQDVKQDPRREHWLPWTIWTSSYALLWWLTMIDPATSTKGQVMYYSLLAYPVLNVFLHFIVGGLAFWGRRQKKLFVTSAAVAGE